MAALMQETTISKETLFNFHHPTGTQFVESGIWMCCTPDAHMATPQILYSTWNVCAAMCRTHCFVRGMVTRHLALPQHQNWWQTVTNILYLKLPLQVQSYSQVTYNKLLITVSWEVSQCDRKGKTFFLGKHWIKESHVKNEGCRYQAGYHNWLWTVKVMRWRVTAE